VLTSLGISLDEARTLVEEIIGHGDQAPAEHMPFTPRAKKVLELSLQEALQLGHNYIGTEHILLGLLREGEGVAAQVMVRLGAELREARNAVIQALAGLSEQTGTGATPADVVIRSLKAENRQLRAQVDDLRAALLRHGSELGAASPPEPDEPPDEPPDQPDEG
jgi:ATP-dependent Clp protease ATP-binding subunit ClpA